MSHYVSFNTMGDAELVLGSGEDAWHSFGTIFPQGVPLHKAMEIAFPWTGEKEQLVRLSTGQKSEAWGIYRSDSGVEIGTCSASYELIQPAEMFDFLSGFFEENLFYIESAGALKGGKVLFCQAKIGTIDVLGSGDKHQTYLTFNNSFDGSIAAQVYMTLVREVCWNTVNMGLRSKDSATVKFRHTKNVHTKLSQEQSRLIMEGAQATDTNIRQALDKLATLKPTRKTYEAYLDSLFPQDTAQAKNAKAEVTALFADNDNNFVPEFAGTAYAALNAVTRYVDHHAHVRITKNSATKDIQSQRFESSLLGAGATLKDKALERILVLTDGTETCESTPTRACPRPLLHAIFRQWMRHTTLQPIARQGTRMVLTVMPPMTWPAIPRMHWRYCILRRIPPVTSQARLQHALSRPCLLGYR